MLDLFGEAKVDDFTVTSRVKHYVVQLDVPMDDALGVQVGHPRHDLQRHPHCLARLDLLLE